MASRFTPPADLSRYDAYIFDCDGTLVDSMPAHFKAWRIALAAAGAPFDFTWLEFLSRAGMSLQRTADELEQKYNYKLDRTVLAEVKSTSYHALLDTVEPIAEVVDFARSLQGRFPMAVASGSRKHDVEQVLTRLDLMPLFSAILTPSDVVQGKPDPEIFLQAARRLGVPPQRCLVLEDGESGFEAARRANMDLAVILPALEPSPE